MKTARIVVGFIIWCAAAAATWWCVVGRGGQSLVPTDVSDQLWRYAAGQRQIVALDFDFAAPVAAGDPIFVVRSPDRVQQIGEVARINRAEGRLTAEAMFYASAPPLDHEAQLAFHQTPASMAWVIETMLPEEKRRAVAQELSAAFAAHHEEIIESLRPVVVDGLREAFQVAEQDLPAAVTRRRERFEQIGGRYQREIVQRELLPLVREEIWPVVRRHAEPAVDEVGREIWQRASLWRFAWRYVYDRSPLPEQNLTRREWQRFVDEEAVPVLENHIEDFVRVQQKILSDVARNPQVQETARKSLGRVLEDPEVQQMAWEIVQEVVIDNPRMHEVFRQQWQSEEAERAFRIAAARLEPTAVRIGELLLGTPEGGITPEFARVLRNQVLGKDQRWLVLEHSTSPSVAAADLPERLAVRRGPRDALHPFVRQAGLNGK
jgi:hypothetical protein